VHIISRRPLIRFIRAHPDAAAAVDTWWATASKADWRSNADVQATFPRADGVGEGRIRFDLAGGEYRLIVAFVFARKVAFVKFIGSHAEYDKVDAATVSDF
jgi:mRNA interferase HigB